MAPTCEPLFTCEMCQTGWAFLNFFFHLPKLFLDLVSAIKFDVNDYLLKTITFISLNMTYLVFVVHSIKSRLNMISKSLRSVFMYVLHNAPNWLELGLYMNTISTEERLTGQGQCGSLPKSFLLICCCFTINPDCLHLKSCTGWTFKRCRLSTPQNLLKWISIVENFSGDSHSDTLHLDSWWCVHLTYGTLLSIL